MRWIYTDIFIFMQNNIKYIEILHLWHFYEIKRNTLKIYRYLYSKEENEKSIEILTFWNFHEKIKICWKYTDILWKKIVKKILHFCTHLYEKVETYIKILMIFPFYAKMTFFENVETYIENITDILRLRKNDILWKSRNI